MSSQEAPTPPDEPLLSGEDLAAAQTAIIREIPDKMRRSIMGAFAGSAAVAIDRRSRYSNILVYHGTDPQSLVEGRRATDPQSHEAPASIQKTDGDVDIEYVTFRHPTTRLIIGEEHGEDRVEHTITRRIPHRGHSIHAQDIDQIETITRECKVSETDFQTMRDKNFPWVYRPSHIDAQEPAQRFSHAGENIYLARSETAVRLFQDPTYNHIEVNSWDGETTRIFGSGAKDMIPGLIKSEFVHEYNPRVDTTTIRQYKAAQAQETKRQWLQKLVNEAGDFETWYELDNPTAYAGSPEGQAVGDLPSTFSEAFKELSESPTGDNVLRDNALEALAEARKIDSYTELAAKNNMAGDTVMEQELRRDFPALSKARTDYITELTQYVSRGQVPESTVRNMIVGFDAVVIALVKSDAIKESLQLLEYRGLADHLSQGIEITSQLGEDDESGEDLTDEIAALKTDHRPLWALRRQLNLDIASETVTQALLTDEELREDPDFDETFSNLPLRHKTPAKEIMFGSSHAIFTVREYLKVAAGSQASAGSDTSLEG